MKPFYQTADCTLYHGDCREIMAALPDGSVDAVVTDPPYGLEFMGKEWDKLGAVVQEVNDTANRDGNWTTKPFGGGGQRVRYGKSAASMQAWHLVWATEALRIIKPGAHLLAFGGTRTYHRLACAIEDAGFEIRDCIRSLNGDVYPAWVFGNGFPKSLSISKAIDKAPGAEREVVGQYRVTGNALTPTSNKGGTYAVGAPNSPATEAAKQWDGWGTALKPAWEPICLARAPLGEKTVAANVLKHGTGALNIDGCRVPTNGDKAGGSGKPPLSFNGENHRPFHDNAEPREFDRTTGRWPANVIIDDSPEIAAEFDKCGKKGAVLELSQLENRHTSGSHHGDSGTPARFFYCAKASRRERGEGNSHPTVKPLSLISYLCRLACPPGGTILDPFAGSGTTGLAAIQEGMKAILIEREESYCEIIIKRLKAERDKQPLLAGGAA